MLPERSNQASCPDPMHGSSHSAKWLSPQCDFMQHQQQIHVHTHVWVGFLFLYVCCFSFLVLRDFF